MSIRTATMTFSISTVNLQTLMESRGSDAVQALETQFQGLQGLMEALRVDPTRGISADEQAARREIFGANEIPSKPPKSIFVLMWEALQDVTLIILIIAALISLGLSLYVKYVTHASGEEAGWIESVAIMAAVVVVVLVVSFNDWQKERQFQGLQQKVEAAARVQLLRNGEIVSVLHKEIVVGDICLVKYGDVLPADGVIIQSSDLMVDESSLTGESDYVIKSTTVDPLLLSSSRVMEGTGRMVVIAVGTHSQAGIIFGLLQNQNEDEADVESTSKVSAASKATSNTEAKEKSILQNKLTLLAIQIGYAGTFVASVTVLILSLSYVISRFIQSGNPWDTARDISMFVNYFIIGVTVLVVAVPEGLPLAVTISLAYSVKKMMNDNNLVRHLDACETMGNATSICSDKTGTLTTNRMTAVKYHIMGKIHSSPETIGDMPENLKFFLTVGSIVNCSYSTKLLPPDKHGALVIQMGNKTECAILGFVESLKSNVEEIRRKYPEENLFKVYTFNSVRKSMSTVLEGKERYFVFTKGASELLLDRCKWIIGPEGTLKLIDEEERENIMKNVIMTLANDGLRTILMAYKSYVKDEQHANMPNEFLASKAHWDNEDEVVNKLTCYAIIGIEDPVRSEVPAAIAKCQRAGITVRMVTGDNINTARSIAYKCGIIHPGEKYDVLDSKQFNERIRDPNTNSFVQAKFDLVYPNLRVLARSSPQDKYNLVNGIINSFLYENREIVAVTGDGTNDGPALKKADVGFAMGIAGTDVAKEASDIILTDDNFNSIVKAVMWGRNVYDSITKFLQFQLTVNVVAIIIAFIGACFISDSPLKAIQMLWVNLIMDTLASLALSTEIPTEELLERAPYGRTSSLINITMIKNIIGQALYQILVIILLLSYGDKLLKIDHGETLKHIGFHGPNKHYTMIFNTFVFMTLFNEFNARKIHGQRNVFSGLHRNPLFLIIWIFTVIIQIFIIQFGGSALSTMSLDANEWFWCLTFGMGGLLWSQVIISIPDSVFPQINVSNNRTDKNTLPVLFSKESKDSQQLVGQILWLKGLKRIQSQMLVVGAFQYALENKFDTGNINFNNLRRRQISKANQVKPKVVFGDHFENEQKMEKETVI